jgi:hypothetical protein
MLQETQNIESNPIESEPARAAQAPQPAQAIKAASLTGSLVQRGRDRAPRLPTMPVLPVLVQPEPAATPAPAPAPALAPVSEEVPLVFARPRRKAESPAPRASRWSEALFVAACCAAFFATFLFVLRF